MNSSSDENKQGGDVTDVIILERNTNEYLIIPSSIKDKVKSWFPNQKVIFIDEWK